MKPLVTKRSQPAQPPHPVVASVLRDYIDPYREDGRPIRTMILPDGSPPRLTRERPPLVAPHRPRGRR